MSANCESCVDNNCHMYDIVICVDNTLHLQWRIRDFRRRVSRVIHAGVEALLCALLGVFLKSLYSYLCVLVYRGEPACLCSCDFCGCKKLVAPREGAAARYANAWIRHCAS